MNQLLYNDLNTLTSFLNQTKVVDLIRQFYARYGNDAPPTLLELYLSKIEKHLKEYYEPLTSLTEIETRLAKLKKESEEEIKELENKRINLIREGHYECPKCKVNQPLHKYIALQNYWYEEPYSCSGGDHWHDDTVDLICPSCSTKIRPLDNQTTFHFKKHSKSYYEIYDNVIDWYASYSSKTAYAVQHNGDKVELSKTQLSFDAISRIYQIDFEKANSAGNFVNIKDSHDQCSKI